MWPFRKNNIGPPNASVAIAYLKVAIPAADTSPIITLPHDDSPVLTTFGKDLLVAYVVDGTDAFTYIQHRDLSSSAITQDQLHETGLQNLAAIANNRNLRVFPHPSGEMFGVLLDGNFEASLILLDSLWDGSFRQFVKGDYIIAIPTRDVLAFCDSRSSAGREQLRGILDQLKNSKDHPLSQDLYVRRNGKWEPENAA